MFGYEILFLLVTVWVQGSSFTILVLLVTILGAKYSFYYSSLLITAYVQDSSFPILVLLITTWGVRF